MDSNRKLTVAAADVEESRKNDSSVLEFDWMLAVTERCRQEQCIHTVSAQLQCHSNGSRKKQDKLDGVLVGGL